MELDKCIKSRRSCRDYLDKEIPMDLIGEILEAASYAPSAGNMQNWKFIVVSDEKKKCDMAKACINQAWMNEAPIHIVVCNDISKMEELYGDRGGNYSIQACAGAGQNIMLKAHELGLGTCWVGGFDENAVKNILNIPDNIRIEMIITLGYPNSLDKESRRDPAEFVTYFDEFGAKEISERFRFPKLKKKIVKKLKGIVGK